MIEYYDRAKDPVKLYFLDKMQNIISAMHNANIKKKRERNLDMQGWLIWKFGESQLDWARWTRNLISRELYSGIGGFGRC